LPKVPFPNSDPDAWDSVLFVLGSGAKTIENAKVTVVASNDIDVQKPKGKNGAGIVFNGKNPAKITIKALAWENKDPLQFLQPQSTWEVLQDTIPALLAQTGAFSISHPQTAMLGIRRVVLDSITLNPPPEGGDRFEAEIVLTEFLDKTTTTASVSKRIAPRAQQLADVVPLAETLKPSSQP